MFTSKQPAAQYTSVFGDDISALYGSNSSAKREEQSLVPKFLTPWNTQPGTSRDLLVITTQESEASAFSKLTTSAKSIFTRVQGAPQAAYEAAEERTYRYLYFAMSFIAGCICLFHSVTLLVFFVFVPQKFAIPFTLGSMLIINSFGLLQGYKNLVTHMTSGGRLVFAALYTVSLVGTLIATLYLRSYLLTVVAASLQGFSLVALLLSYIRGTAYAFNFIRSFAGALFGRGGGAWQSVLPL